MNPNLLNTRAARGLPTSTKNRRTRNSLACRLGFHKWRRINDISLDTAPSMYPPDLPVDYISPKRRCSCCGRIEWFVGPEVCGGSKPRWVQGPLSCTHRGTDDCPLCDPARKPEDLDDEDPMWLVNAQIDGLLQGEGATEDHDSVQAFLRSTGLAEGVVKRVHRAIVFGDEKTRRFETRAERRLNHTIK